MHIPNDESEMKPLFGCSGTVVLSRIASSSVS